MRQPIHRVEHLTPAQKKVKQKRHLIYEGEHANYSAEKARDIIELYLVHQLGYSPIRHILGEPNDHRIEDVIRQHMFGRKEIDCDAGELRCPGSSDLTPESAKRIIELSEKYGTNNDPYILEITSSGRWRDDPVVSNKCPTCGNKIKEEDHFCSNCGRKVNRKEKKLYDID